MHLTCPVFVRPSLSPVPCVRPSYKSALRTPQVIEELAPELLPMLMGLESPANFIPVTNELLGELQRRGVSRDQLLQCLKVG